MSDSIYDIKDFSIHFLPSYYTHQMNRTDDTSGFTIAFSDAFINQLQKFENKINYSNYFSKIFILNLEKDIFSEFDFYFEELFKSKDDKSYFLNLISLFLLKLIKASELFPSESKNLNFENQILKLVNNNYKQKPKLDFYAKIMNISATTLNRRMNECFGKTLAQIQNDKIIQEAKHRLAENCLSIKQIAFSLQFNNEGHFSVFFKQNTGICPRDFKKSRNINVND